MLLFAVLVVFLGAAFAVNIDHCQNIGQPGVYDLNASFSGATVATNDGNLACIRINASDVSLDCHGNNLDNWPLAGLHYGIIAEPDASLVLKNITVKNCGLYYYNTSVYAYKTNGSFFLGNNVHGFQYAGLKIKLGDNNLISGNSVYSGGDDAFIIINGNHNTLSNNIANYSRNAFRLIPWDVAAGSGSCDYNALSNNNATYYRNGFELGGCKYNNFTDNSAFYSLENGFYLHISNDGSRISDHNRLLRNRAYNNSMNGFFLNGGGYNELTDNTAQYNGALIDGVTSLYGGEGLFGYYLYNSYNNNLTSNIAWHNMEGFVAESSGFNTFTGNTAHENYIDFHIMASPIEEVAIEGAYPPSSYNTLVSNIAYDSADLDLPPYSTNFARCGFVVESSSYNNITLNTAYNVYAGFIVVTREGSAIPSLNNILVNNVAYDYTLGGFAALRSQYTAFIGNTAHDNLPPLEADADGPFSIGPMLLEEPGIGFLSDNSLGTNFTNDVAYNNDFVGFYLDDYDCDATISHSTSYNNYAGYLELRSTGVPDEVTVTVTDGCISTIEDSSFYNNGWELVQLSTSGYLFNVSHVTLGLYPQVTISIWDSLGDSDSLTAQAIPPGYFINETTDPSHGLSPGENLTSFRSQYLKVNYTDPGVLLDSLTFHYLPGGYNESTIAMYTWNGTWNDTWMLTTPQDPADTVAHSISAYELSQLTNDDVYGLFAIATPVQEEGGGQVQLKVSESISCAENNQMLVTVNVTRGAGTAVHDATVYFGALGTNMTNADGVATYLVPCGSTMEVYAAKPSAGYKKSVIDTVVADCSNCPGFCAVGAYCPPICTTGQELVNGQCVPQCTQGLVRLDSRCVQCTSDANCQSGYTCDQTTHNCRPECTSDDDCAPEEYCQAPVGATVAAGGTCQPVPTGDCGQILNHKWESYKTSDGLPYECGDEPGCKQCPQGYECSEHKCVQKPSELCGPDTVFVGDTITMDCLRPGEEVTITDPNGKQITATADANGNVFVPAAYGGTYSFSTAGGSTHDVDAVPKPAPGQPGGAAPAGEGAPLLIWIVILLALGIGGWLLWKQRRR